MHNHYLVWKGFVSDLYCIYSCYWIIWCYRPREFAQFSVFLSINTLMCFEYLYCDLDLVLCFLKRESIS